MDPRHAESSRPDLAYLSHRAARPPLSFHLRPRVSQIFLQFMRANKEIIFIENFRMYNKARSAIQVLREKIHNRIFDVVICVCVGGF